jgi:hypothetical protein
MEELKIPLTRTNPRGQSLLRISQAVSGVCWIIVGVLREQSDEISIAFIVVGFAMFLLSWFLPLLDKEYQIIVDEKGIRGSIGRRASIDLPWERISSAELGILRLELHTTDGKAHSVNLEDLTYRDHQELKPRLARILAERGLLRNSKANSPQA